MGGLTSARHMPQVTGVPVVKSESDKTLVGVLSKKDLAKKGKLVSDIYSHPPVAARPENKVADAACLMLKHKVRGKGSKSLALMTINFALECMCAPYISRLVCSMYEEIPLVDAYSNAGRRCTVRKRSKCWLWTRGRDAALADRCTASPSSTPKQNLWASSPAQTSSQLWARRPARMSRA